MDHPPTPPHLGLVTSYPNVLLPTGIAAYDERFRGVERGTLVALCAGEADLVAEMCARAAVAQVRAGLNVALADYRRVTAPWLRLAELDGERSEVKQHRQRGVPVGELVQRTAEWMDHDSALAALIVVDLGDLSTPRRAAATDLKRLARDRKLVVLVGSVAPEPGVDGKLLGDFADLPDPADVLVHLERRRTGPLFPPSTFMHVRKARAHPEASIAVRPDHEGGWV